MLSQLVLRTDTLTSNEYIQSAESLRSQLPSNRISFCVITFLCDVFSGEADKTPSFAQQTVLDQGTSIVGMTTAADNEEVPVSLCIIV